MIAEHVLLLARVTQANISRWQAVREMDDSIAAALQAGISTRTIARHAGLDHSAIVRRAQRTSPTTTDRSHT